jgi:uncharacterized membrane protein YvlD (DUF360 family)
MLVRIVLRLHVLWLVALALTILTLGLFALVMDAALSGLAAKLSQAG